MNFIPQIGQIVLNVKTKYTFKREIFSCFNTGIVNTYTEQIVITRMEG